MALVYGFLEEFLFRAVNAASGSLDGGVIFCYDQFGDVVMTFKAVYENGMLRPLEPLPFPEHELVEVTVINNREAFLEWLDADFLSYLETQADDSITLEQVRAELSMIAGSMAEVIRQEREDRV